MPARRALLAILVFMVLPWSALPVVEAQPLPVACGTPLSDSEIGDLAALSDTTTLTGDPLRRLEDAVDRHHRITEILVAHGDRRGLFSLGLDTVEQSAVMPLQHDPAAFASPDYAHAISLELLRRYLDNLHGEFTGGPVESHWANYFDLAQRCDVSPARAAMAGYNAHLTVDLAYSVAAVGTRPENASDYFRIVGAIGDAGFEIVDRTEAVYAADLGPLWRFYFLGEGLDRLLGAGVATRPLLRTADLGFNVVVFGNGLALRNPAAHDATAAEIRALFTTADVAFEVLARLHAL
ncbi:DUF5995 family protein [Nocardia sp. NPDC003482]